VMDWVGMGGGGVYKGLMTGVYSTFIAKFASSEDLLRNTYFGIGFGHSSGFRRWNVEDINCGIFNQRLLLYRFNP
jgi:hypothetical protein